MAARRTRRAENREVAEAADFELRRRAKSATAQQHANAYMTNAGPKVWAVVGKWVATDAERMMHKGLTYRQAKASARAIREACGYANVVKAA